MLYGFYIYIYNDEGHVNIVYYALLKLYCSLLKRFLNQFNYYDCHAVS